jgi:hypothetical protein
MRTVVAVILVVGVALLAGPRAEAQSAADKKRAETLFNEARALMDKASFAAACPKLEESHELDPATGTAFNLALCYEKSNRFASAVVWYGKSREAALAAKQQKRVEFADAQIAALTPKAARLVVTVTTPVAGLSVTRGGAPVTAGAPELVDAGTYVVEASAPDHQPFRQEVTATDGKLTTVEVALVPSPVVKPEPVPLVDTGSDDGGRETRLILGWSTLGAGVAITGVGLILGLGAKSKWDDARALCPEGSASCSDEAVELADSAKSRALLSTIVTSVGIVGVGVGVVLLVTAPKKRSAEKTTFMPVVGKDMVGIAISGGF